MMGYGGTVSPQLQSLIWYSWIQKDAPNVPPESIQLYTMKRASDDIAELARQLGVKRIVLGGHDWYVHEHGIS
jgi:pimeloyl-ACP methyl ester carboxylesterase